jgi:hypothetical protein
MIKTLVKSPITLLRRYNNSLLKAPYKTKMATAGTTYFIADNICQRLIEKKSPEEYSLTRSLRQAAVGALFAAPSLHIWHSGLLPKIIKPISSKMKGVLVAVFLNETVLASYFIACLLFSFEALKTLDPQAGVKNVKEKFGSAIVTSMKFWTGISFINYGLLPVHLRPVFVSCWSVVWQSYLSYVSNNRLNSIKQKTITEIEEEISEDYGSLMI